MFATTIDDSATPGSWFSPSKHFGKLLLLALGFQQVVDAQSACSAGYYRTNNFESCTPCSPGKNSS